MMGKQKRKKKLWCAKQTAKLKGKNLMNRKDEISLKLHIGQDMRNYISMCARVEKLFMFIEKVLERQRLILVISESWVYR